ncbi:NAD-dependent epimerase/dehydratase family protein, partial [Neobacillus niacini]|uniref:NAD-dependent epimerase/dehydratase family protein n=1 Tax=Neobacillus niacini TaxID=86668 RepID=UPI003001B9CC
MIKKVIITGANGFLGSALTNFLANIGVKVIAVVRNENSSIERINQNKNIEIINCELSEIAKLKELITARDIDVFYHLAWSGVSDSHRDDYHSQIKNIKYTCDCVEFCRILSCKAFVFASSLWEYECYKT